MHWETYRVMRSTDEALEYMGRFQGKARLVAGGTDLVIQLREKNEGKGIALLDISSVSEMKRIELSDDGRWVLIGAAVTMTELTRSEIISKHGRALGTGASYMGAPQIRNVATIGGNVVNAQPAADGTIPLLALGAEAMVVSAEARDWIALEKLFIDVGKSAIDRTKQIVTHFRFRTTGETEASSLHRLARRKAFTLPTLVAACKVALDAKKQVFEEVCMAVGPVARTPWVAREAAEGMRGRPVSREEISRAAAAARIGVNPRDSIRGGAEYRTDMVEVLIRRAITECVDVIGAGI